MANNVNLTDMSVRRNNMRIVEMERGRRTALVSDVCNDASVENPVFISLVYESETDGLGDINIELVENEEIDKTVIKVSIVALTSDDFGDVLIHQSAVRIGIKELLQVLKSSKVTTNTIYMYQNSDIYWNIDMIDTGLSVQEVLVNNNLANKINLWVEKLEDDHEEMLDYDDDECCCSCKKDSKKKDKKKSKDKNKKKNKKKGKKK